LSIVSSVFSLTFLDPINWPKQIALATLTPLILSYSLKGKLQVLRAKPLIPILVGLYIISGLLSMLIGQQSVVRELWGTFGRNNGFITFLCFGLLVLAGFALGNNTKKLVNLLWPLQIMTISAGFYGYAQTRYIDPVQWSQDGQAFSFFGNINFASAIYALGAISSFSLILLRKPKRTETFYHLTLMVFQLYMVYLTDSIQGILMFLIAFILLSFIVVQRRSQIFSLAMLFAAFIAGVFLFISFLGFGPFGEDLYQYTLKLRFFYWLSGIYIGLNNLWYGAGFDSYGDVYRDVRPDAVIDITGVDITVNNAHNSIIQIFATLGIFPTLLLVSLYILALFACIKVLVLRNSSLEMKIFSSVFIPLAINSLFSIDNISIGVWNYLFLGIALSFFAFDKSKETSTSNEPISTKKGSIVKSRAEYTRLIGVTAALVGFSVSWASSYPERAIVSAFQLNYVSNQTNVVDPRINQLEEISRSPLARDQNFRYIAEGLSKLGQNELAVAVLFEGIERFPREYQLFDYLAVFLERLNRKEEAVLIREKQISLDPNHPKILLYLALDLSDLGRKDEALKVFEEVLKLQKYLSVEDIAMLKEYNERIRSA
jgi:O-antigen ligase